MVYKTKDLFENSETEYSIRNKLANGELFMVERGIYSDESDQYIDEIYISKKYTNAIFTNLSAFYIYGLTDQIPDKHYVSTSQHSFPIRRKDVSQSYQDSSFFTVGKTTIDYKGGKINIYDLERLLIELVRLKQKYAPELYYEVLNAFRGKKEQLDFYKINQYVKYFRNGQNLLQRIKEVI